MSSQNRRPRSRREVSIEEWLACRSYGARSNTVADSCIADLLHAGAQNRRAQPRQGRTDRPKREKAHRSGPLTRYYVERTTRFELATPTLARLCSTN